MSITSKTVEKRTSFKIAKYRIIKIAVEIVNEIIIDLTLYNVLYTPNLYSNLIFISKIYILDLAITFRENEIIASLDDDKTAIYSIKHKSLYYFRIVDKPKTFIVKLMQKLDIINN